MIEGLRLAFERETGNVVFLTDRSIFKLNLLGSWDGESIDQPVFNHIGSIDKADMDNYIKVDLEKIFEIAKQEEIERNFKADQKCSECENKDCINRSD